MKPGSVRGTSVVSPLWRVLRDSAEMMAKLGGRSGLTPADRAGLDLTSETRVRQADQRPRTAVVMNRRKPYRALVRQTHNRGGRGRRGGKSQRASAGRSWLFRGHQDGKPREGRIGPHKPLQSKGSRACSLSATSKTVAVRQASLIRILISLARSQSEALRRIRSSGDVSESPAFKWPTPCMGVKRSRELLLSGPFSAFGLVLHFRQEITLLVLPHGSYVLGRPPAASPHVHGPVPRFGSARGQPPLLGLARTFARKLGRHNGAL